MYAVGETGEAMSADDERQSDEQRLARYGEKVRALGVAPLWEFFSDWFSATPRVAAEPFVWRYDTLRPLLLEAAAVITAEQAERRVLALENPGLGGHRLAIDSLYAGLQLILPGEIAPSHRHSPAALRFILEGHDAYTAVEGERAYMSPGDFIVTPSWAWHEHGNEGRGPTIWLDVLDVALIRFLGAGFSEHYVSREFPKSAPPGDSRYRFGRNMRPAGYRRGPEGSPVFSYPYSQSREILERLRVDSPPDPRYGLKMEYVDPTTGGPAIPTLSTFLQLVPRGFVTQPYRTTAATLFAVVEGRGFARVTVGETTRDLQFGPRDIFVVPSWQSHTIDAQTDLVLFSASDEAVQRTLNVWREEPGR